MAPDPGRISGSLPPARSARGPASGRSSLRHFAPAPRRLDVLIPSYNRGPLLEQAVRSVLHAAPAPGLHVHITVICNDCTDDSRERMARMQTEACGRLSVIDEPRRGKSRALNTGIAATSGDLVGMIDDDEEVDRQWLCVVAAAFEDERLDFIGGPYIACWDTPLPEWIPADYLAVVGAVDNGAEERVYDRDFPGILKGGNAVIRRRTLERVGPYDEYLGPNGFSRLFSCEDEEMYLRLLEKGARGKYLPGLIIHHHVQNTRLTPKYYRQWCFWRGVSRGLMDPRHRLPVPYLAGVPRFMFGRAARGLIGLGRGVVRRHARAERLGQELCLWDLAGYFFGKHAYPLARFSPVTGRRSGTARGVTERDPSEPEGAPAMPLDRLREADDDVAISV